MAQTNAGGAQPVPALFFAGVQRRYRQGEGALEILRGTDLAIWPGELVALVAPSGAGKSTLLHIAGLLERPDGGEVYIGGQPTAGMSDGERTRLRREEMGFVYQFHHLLPEFSALENVVLPQLIRGLARKEAEARAAELLSFLGLKDRLPHRPAELSGESSSALPSPAPSPMAPACCWPTSRPAILTRRPRAASSASCSSSCAPLASRR
ncbi:hypothetical protein GCM10025880_38830 [Methylorubrum aminovorans]|nr:hypothetical protein GCM10025880_38830 [Methylorubrum aminovorans]